MSHAGNMPTSGEGSSQVPGGGVEGTGPGPQATVGGRRTAGGVQVPGRPLAFGDAAETGGVEAAAQALAVYRLTKLVIDDKITEPLRDWVFAQPGVEEGRGVAYLLQCPWCVSIWVGVGMTLARRRWPRVWRLAADVLAMSAVAGWLDDHQ